MSIYQSTKVIELGSCAFRQWLADPNLATGGLARSNNQCYKLHGYQLKAKFTFGCSSLDERNWCVDYGSLKPLKAILNEQFDHTTTISATDPALHLFQQLHDANACNLKIMDGVGVEKVAEFCFNAAEKFLKESYGDRCWVESVEVFEHEANSSIYSKVKAAVANETTSYVVTSTETLPAIPEPAAAPVQEAPTPEVITPSKPSNAAAVGNNITSGWSNPFAGTSWGV